MTPTNSDTPVSLGLHHLGFVNVFLKNFITHKVVKPREGGGEYHIVLVVALVSSFHHEVVW